MKDTIADRLQAIRQRVERACTAYNRDPATLRLLLATKTVSAERIKEALQAGHSLIGENKVQEIKDKHAALADMPHEMHFIGHLQSNKIKDIVRYGVSCLQSLDRAELAEQLHRRLKDAGQTLDVLIQVNTSGEASKFGVAPEHCIELVRQVAQYPTLRIKGLMTIGLFSAEAEKVRPCFRRLRQLRDEVQGLNLAGVDARELSMGMSNDLETAIAEGATIVRVGTAVFGERSYPDSYYWNEQA
jgi:pyridoxal phosphate enzyme (YggS family)